MTFLCAKAVGLNDKGRIFEIIWRMVGNARKLKYIDENANSGVCRQVIRQIHKY